MSEYLLSTSLQGQAAHYMADRDPCCSHCCRHLPEDYFRGYVRTYRTCRDCRGRNKSKSTGSLAEGSQTNVLVPTTLDQLQSNFANHVRMDANAVQQGYHFECAISIGRQQAHVNDSELAKVVCSALANCDGYRYIFKNVKSSRLKPTCNFYAVCSQSAAYHKDTHTERVRKTKKKELYPCGGRLTGVIDRKAGIVRATVRHDMIHPGPPPPKATPAVVRQFLAQESMRKDARQAFHELKAKYPNERFSQAQVYFWWRQHNGGALKSTFTPLQDDDDDRDDDPQAHHMNDMNEMNSNDDLSEVAASLHSILTRYKQLVPERDRNAMDKLSVEQLLQHVDGMLAGQRRITSWTS